MGLGCDQDHEDSPGSDTGSNINQEYIIIKRL
jgi:hypothetical protein